MPIQVGLKGRAETTVTPQNTAAAMGSGHSPVFATPAMVALMEQAAFTSLLPYLPEGEGTVGVHMDVVHESASPVGMKVWAESEVVSVDDRQIAFSVTAYDTAGPIGFGTHTRVRIGEERFAQRAQSKLGQTT